MRVVIRTESGEVAESQATAGAYSIPDMDAVVQKLPSDEEVAERDREREAQEKEDAEKKAKEKADKSSKKEADAAPDNFQPDSDDDDSGDDGEESFDDEEGGDDESDEEGDEEEDFEEDDEDSSDEDSDDGEEATASVIPYPELLQKQKRTPVFHTGAAPSEYVGIASSLPVDQLPYPPSGKL